MVKGTSRQVIVVKSPDRKLFEQAIFILREDAEGVSDEMLLQEAQLAAQQASRRLVPHRAVWAFGGAVVTGLVWLMTSIL